MVGGVIIVVLCVILSYVSGLDTNIGTIHGNLTTVLNDSYTVHSFKGIPFAKPPIGDLRFAKPVPYGALGNFSAMEYGASCAQIAGGLKIGSEDCLYLNVFTPDTSQPSKSVMIWIYGGSFQTGSSSFYRGDVLAATQDVVVVTINYRLNIFGFLSTGDSSLPGNLGLWDQKLAIEWVKDNIGSFGGNSSKITIFGESAGGRSVSFQMFSPKNNASLFQRAITESGSALSLTFLNRDPLPVLKSVAQNLDCDINDDLIKCLRGKSKDKLLEATQTTKRPFPFYPIVDGDFLPFDLGMVLGNFTKDGATDSVKNQIGSFADYDLFSGWNDQEGLLYMERLKEENGKNLDEGVTEQVLTAALHKYPFYNYGGNNFSEHIAVHLFRDYYINSPEKWVSDGRSIADRRVEAYMRIAGDVALKLPTIQHLQLHAAVSGKNTFAYEFMHKPSHSGLPLWYKGPSWLQTGADHTDEIRFVLGYCLLPFSNYTDEEKDLTRKMMTQWADFAKTGNPGSDYVSFSSENQTYTQLTSTNLTKLKLPLNDVQRLWSALDGAVISAPPLYAVCSDIEDFYLSGLVKLTRREASHLMTVLLVVTILLGLIVLICAVSNIVRFVKSRGKKAI